MPKGKTNKKKCDISPSKLIGYNGFASIEFFKFIDIDFFEENGAS